MKTFLTNTLCTVWGFFVLWGMYVVECGAEEDKARLRMVEHPPVKTLGTEG